MTTFRYSPLIAIVVALALHARPGAAQPAPPTVPTVNAAASPFIPDVPGISRKFVTVNGAKLQYLDFGGRGETVVLLAGLGNTSWIWSDFGPRLAAKGYRVVALTRRGHGESAAPATGYELDSLSADIIAFLDSLGAKRAHIIGHSLAGAELTRIAGLHPERVLKLVYIDAAYDRADQVKRDKSSPGPNFSPRITLADRASLPAYLAYQRRARPDLARRWGPAIERDFAASLMVDSLGSFRFRQRPARFGLMIAGASESAPDYRQVRAPALALYATVSSEILPPGSPDSLRASLAKFERENTIPWTRLSVAQFRTGVRRGQVVRVNGVHHLFIDRPDETLALIVKFLKRPVR